MDMLDNSLEPSDSDDIQLKSEKADDPIPLGDELTIIDEDGSMSDDQTVDSLAHAQAILEADEDCQWKADGVTYRVYHVNPEEHEQESVQEGEFGSGSGHLQPVVLASNNLSTNHFYVVNNEVISPQTARSLAPRSNVVIERQTSSAPQKTRRDDRRRATHNEVERRRRDKINNWIMKLGKIIPDCAAMENNKSAQSKGCILAKACDYISELRTSSQKLAECVKENARLASNVEYLQSVNDRLKLENSLLRQKHGVEPRRNLES